MRILAIDPGLKESAYVIYDNNVVTEFATLPNNKLLEYVNHSDELAFGGCEKLYIEMVASYGMAVGKEVFETCVWIGRFIQAWGCKWEYVYRKDVKIHLCNSMRAKDANIRQAILDIYGGKAAIGTKKNPGPLYGISGDVWSALAVAITATGIKH